MLRKYLNLWTFCNPENWLADDNQVFPCLYRAHFYQGSREINFAGSIFKSIGGQ